MQVICLQTEAFYALVDDVYNRIMEKNTKKADKWISAEEAMKNYASAAKPRCKNSGMKERSHFSQPEKKIILYDSDSIDEYLNKHTPSICCINEI